MIQKTKTPKNGLLKHSLILPAALALIFLSTATTSSVAKQTNEVVERDSIHLFICISYVMPAPPMPPPMIICERPRDPNQVFQLVEQQAEFPGGQRSMTQWLNDNIIYPYEAKSKGIEGRVIVQFIIEKDGSLSDVQYIISRRQGGLDTDNKYLLKEAVRVVKEMPNWQPAKHEGETVRLRYIIPVWFRLPTEE